MFHSFVQVMHAKACHSRGTLQKESRLVMMGRPSPETREGSTPAVAGNHLGDGGGSKKMIRVESGWPREEDYHHTLGHCVIVASSVLAQM